MSGYSKCGCNYGMGYGMGFGGGLGKGSNCICDFNIDHINFYSSSILKEQQR